MAMKSVKIRAEGSTLTLEPVLVNKLGQKVYIARNPTGWKTNYSVWVYGGRGWGVMLASHHRTKALATSAAKRLANKDVLKILGWR